MRYMHILEVSWRPLPIPSYRHLHCDYDLHHWIDLVASIWGQEGICEL
jgi:hypothetical protein